MPLATPLASGAVDDELLFLLDAGASLEASADDQALPDLLAGLAVPRLADWCAVDLVNGDVELRRAAIAHPEPAMRALMADVGRRTPERLDALLGVGKVARTGERELIPEVNDTTLSVMARSPEQLALWRALGLRAQLVVPLRWGGRVLGTLLLAQGPSGRAFDDRTVALAEELARRAAAAFGRASSDFEATELQSALEEARRELMAAHERLELASHEISKQVHLTMLARQQADEASNAKGQFLARMSHELRTPLNAIGGYTQLLEMGVRGPITGDQREDLMRIQRSQRHLLALINDILNFAKLQTGRVIYDLGPVLPSTLVGEVAMLVEPQVRAKRQALELTGMDSGEAALGDAEKMRQILLNLLSNSVKFTSAGGRLRIFVESDDECVRVGVQDSGIGLPPEKLEAVFEPFVQLSHPLADVQQGTGLGLAISRDLARGMGGDLIATSEPGVGSTFTLVLPRAVAERGRGAPVHASASPPEDA